MAQRWDRDRFDRERMGSDRDSSYGGGYPERDRFGPGPQIAPRRQEVLLDERERFDRRGPPGRFEERERFYEEERLPPSRRAPAFLDDPIPPEVSHQALAPYRRPRPQYLRRQSSLDIFDRKPQREEYRLPANVGIPLPIRRPQSPGRGRYYEEVEERYHDSDEDYHDVRVNRGSGRDRSRMRSRSVHRRHRSQSISSESSVEVIAENKVEVIGRRGRTKVPKRLAHKSAVIELGYPFVEEDNFIVVQRALDKVHIDKIVETSKKYREDKTVTYKYDGVTGEKEVVKEKTEVKVEKKEEVIAAPPPPPPVVVAPKPEVITVAPGQFEEIVKKTKTTTTTIDPPDHHHHHQDLAVVVPRHRHQSERDLRREIEALEAEAEALRLERRTDRDWETEARGKKDVYRVERNRKGRSKSRPNPKVVGMAMAALS